MTSQPWDGSLSINNATGAPLYYAVSAGTGTISVPSVYGTLATGVQTISNLPLETGRRIYFSNAQLTDSLFNTANPSNPSPSGPDWDKLYSFWEYSYDAGNFTWDQTYVEEWSYPIQTVVTSAIDGQQRTYGIQSLASTIAQLISQPSFAPEDNKGSTSDLIWTSTPVTFQQQDPGKSIPANSRIIGPEFIWNAQIGQGDSLGGYLPAEMVQFVADVPQNGNDLSPTQTNWTVWQQATDINNGYTTALSAAGQAFTGPQPQIGTPSDFRGFFTYEQDEAYGQVTNGPVPDQLIINGIGDSVSHVYGTSRNDNITGTAGSDTLVGGYGGDRLTGSGGSSPNALHRNSSDTFLYVRADSSLHQRGLRDVITDFDRNDRIDLSAVDADSQTDGRQSFHWIGSRRFSGTAGELRILEKSHASLLQGDTDGNGRVDFEIRLTDVSDFSRTNLLL